MGDREPRAVEGILTDMIGCGADCALAADEASIRDRVGLKNELRSNILITRDSYARITSLSSFQTSCFVGQFSFQRLSRVATISLLQLSNSATTDG